MAILPDYGPEMNTVPFSGKYSHLQMNLNPSTDEFKHVAET